MIRTSVITASVLALLAVLLLAPGAAMADVGEVGADADVLLLDPDSLEVRSTFARGHAYHWRSPSNRI